MICNKFHVTDCDIWMDNALIGTEIQCRNYKGFPIIPFLGRINQISLIETHFSKMHSVIVLTSKPNSSINSIHSLIRRFHY